MIITRKSYDGDGKLTILTYVIKNHNRKTIETFNATPLLEAVGYDQNTVIELLKQNNCEVLTPVEGRALDLYREEPGQSVQITESEFNYAVAHGLKFNEVLKMRHDIDLLKDYEVKL